MTPNFSRRRPLAPPQVAWTASPLQYRRKSTTRKTMPLSGEAIRLMNYRCGVAVTQRRILATIPTRTAEERARSLAFHSSLIPVP
jgi:hypothetical protein